MFPPTPNVVGVASPGSAFGGPIRPQVGIGNKGILPSTAPKPPSPATAYSAAIPTTASNYSNIMSSFQNLFNAPSPSTDFMNQYRQAIATPYQPQQQTYAQTPDERQAIATQQQYAQTGGLTAPEIADMRARGISPIRAVYANAMNQVARQRALQGNYSPGYNSVLARMARDQSQNISDAVTNVNADIAGRVQQGRISSAGQAGATASAQAAPAREIAASNVASKNQAALINRQSNIDLAQKGYASLLDDRNAKMEALRGMISIYGTNPALASTFGSQAAQQAGMQQAANQWAYGTGINSAIGAGYGR